MSAEPVAKPTYRGTSNANCRGNSTTRRQRREWLVATYASDVHVVEVEWVGGETSRYFPTDPAMEDAWLLGLADDDAAVTVEVLPTTRCYRCGCLLTEDTLTVDRIKPGAEGGKYGTPRRDALEGRTNCRPRLPRDHIARPACSKHNSETVEWVPRGDQRLDDATVERLALALHERHHGACTPERGKAACARLSGAYDDVYVLEPLILGLMGGA